MGALPSKTSAPVIMGARPSKAIATATTTPLPPSEATSWPSLWSEELPPELAGLVLRRLLTLADRLRFGSVCRHWRDAARQQASLLPPVLSWTISFFAGIAQTIPDGEEHRLYSGELVSCLCSSENCLLMTRRASRDDTVTRNFLENPVSGATLPLPSLGNLLHPGGEYYLVRKVMVCPENLVVIMTGSRIPPHHDRLIAFCRPGKSAWSQAAGNRYACYEDIAFHDRSIYAITEGGELVAHEVTDEDHGGRHGLLCYLKLVIKGVDTDDCSNVRRFLVVSRGGRLLMVKWNHRYGIYGDDDTSTAFEVFEADLQMFRWSRLSSIGDQALFVSPMCSKAVPVSPNHDDDYMRANCIYFMDEEIYGPGKCGAGATSCGMYDLGNNTYHSVLSHKFNTSHLMAPAWFFPGNCK